MSADRIITSAAAAALQAEANEARELLTWIVSVDDENQPEKIVARPVMADSGALPVLLVADTLSELRATCGGTSRFRWSVRNRQKGRRSPTVERS